MDIVHLLAYHGNHWTAIFHPTVVSKLQKMLMTTNPNKLVMAEHWAFTAPCLGILLSLASFPLSLFVSTSVPF